MALISTSIASTIFLYLCLVDILLLVYSFKIEKVPSLYSKYTVLIPCFLIWFINYRYIVKSRKFLNCEFVKDHTGLVFIFLIVFLLIILFVVLAHLNRTNG